MNADRFFKWPRAEITALCVAVVIFKNWVVRYGAADIILTDSGEEVTPQCFATRSFE